MDAISECFAVIRAASAAKSDAEVRHGADN